MSDNITLLIIVGMFFATMAFITWLGTRKPR